MNRSSSDRKGDNKLLFEIQMCQKNIVTADVNVKKCISDVSACRGTNMELNKLCQVTKDSLKHMTDHVHELDVLALQVKSAADRDELLGQVRNHGNEIENNRQSLRRATLQSIQAIEALSRQQLLAGGTPDLGPRKRAMKTDNSADQLRQQTSDVTKNLTGLVSRMHDQVKQSEDTLQNLVGSSQVIGETETEFVGMGSTIQSSGKLLSKYSRRELTDKILIALALCLFFACVLYVMRKRLLWFW